MQQTDRRTFFPFLCIHAVQLPEPCETLFLDLSSEVSPFDIETRDDRKEWEMDLRGL